jgi:hypothetical protein
MLQRELNVTYTAIHCIVVGRNRPANLAVYTGSGNQWVFGLRVRASIDARKYPAAADEAENVLSLLREAIAAQPQGVFRRTPWGGMPQDLRSRFMRADDDHFARNYHWYSLDESPGAVVDAALPDLPQ